MATDRELTVANWTPEQLDQVQEAVVDVPVPQVTMIIPTAVVTPGQVTYVPN